MQRQRAGGVSGQALLHPGVDPFIKQLFQHLFTGGVVESCTLPLVEPQDEPDVLEEEGGPELALVAGAQFVHHSRVGHIEWQGANAALAVFFRSF